MPTTKGYDELQKWYDELQKWYDELQKGRSTRKMVPIMGRASS